MWIDEDREVVESNVYHIPERLREIDPGYFVVYNHKDKEFEVHHKEQIGGTFCLSIPYPELDYRTIQRVRETRIERARIIMEQMEIAQEAREKAAYDKILDETGEKLKEIHRYVAPKGVADTIPDDAYSTRFI